MPFAVTAHRIALESPLVRFDPDARDYITRVERADGQALETGVRQAIDAFVRGCKSDGTWNAIKASCILAGARTLAGALVPLKGTAPTNFNFVSGDYSRKTGLVGNGSTKYLNTNRNSNADPQDSAHVSVYASAFSGTIHLLTDGVSGANSTGLYSAGFRARSNTAYVPTYPGSGFAGVSRSKSADFDSRISNATVTTAATSNTPTGNPYLVFSNTANFTTSRITYYSVGEALDLALLDARVTTLVNTLNSVIP